MKNKIFLSIILIAVVFSIAYSAWAQDAARTKKHLIWKGNICYREGLYEKAIDFWGEALAMQPGDKSIEKKILKAENIIAENARKSVPVKVQKKPEKLPDKEPKQQLLKPVAKKSIKKQQKEKPDEKPGVEPEEKPSGKPSSLWSGLGKFFRKEVGVVNISPGPAEPAEPRVFNLNECINIAMANNIQIQVSRKNIKLAEMKILEARRNMLASATIVYEQYHGRFQGRAYFGRKQYIEGQQPVFNPELFFKIKEEEKKLEIARQEYRKARNELVMQVKKAYYSFAKAKENMRAQEELFNDVNKILDMVNKAYVAGVTSKLDMLNVTSQANQAKYQLTAAKTDLGVTELTLLHAMFVNNRERIDINVPPAFKKINVDLDEALAMANVNRPEVRINTLKLDYYGYEKDVAKSKGWPKVDLLGNWGLAKEEYMSPDFVPGVDVNQRLEQQWYGGVKVTVPFWGNTAKYSYTREQWQPNIAGIQYGTEAKTEKFEFGIFDKLSYYSDKQLADIDVDKARQELIKARQDTALEVREGCYDYEKALAQLDWAKSKMEYQATDLDVMKMKRGLDEALDSDVVESMIKLSQEKFGYFQAIADCYISIATINKAIGVEDYFRTDDQIKSIEVNSHEEDRL